LESSATPEDYAQAIKELFDTPDHLNSLRQNAWPSIEHLTIEQMAKNFIHGVNIILGS
jgi:hypothetical protein